MSIMSWLQLVCSNRLSSGLFKVRLLDKMWELMVISLRTNATSSYLVITGTSEETDVLAIQASGWGGGGWLVISAVAVRAVKVYGGGFPPPALSDQLVQPMAEVLHLTGAQNTPHPHQVAVAPRTAAIGMTAVPWRTLPDGQLQLMVSIKQQVGRLLRRVFVRRGSPDLLWGLVPGGSRRIRRCQEDVWVRWLQESRRSG